MRRYIFVVIFIILCVHLYAQMGNHELVIGKKFPQITLSNIEHHSKKELSTMALRGKWFVLDFFSSGCGACVASFPEVNKMNADYKNQVQFILIGFPDHKVRAMFEKFREKQHLDLPVTFDSSLFTRFHISGVPFQIIVDEIGIIRGLTSKLRTQDIIYFINRNPKKETVYLPESKSRVFSFDPKKPFLVDNNGGQNSNFVYRSLLSKWDASMPSYYLHDDLSVCLKITPGKFQLLKVGLNTLYRFAYFGYGNFDCEMPDSLYQKVSSRLLLNIRDSSTFDVYEGPDAHLFCYSLVFQPDKINKVMVMEILKNDLRNYFHYDAAILTNKISYWKLTTTYDHALSLKTKGDTTFLDMIPHAGFNAKNYPIKNLIRALWAHHSNEIFIDETGIVGNIDLNLDCIFTDLQDVKKGLEKVGLNLLRGEKDMKVLVIRDPN